MSINKPQKVLPKRIASIDALRGFDMIWILGAQGIFLALFSLTSWPLFNTLNAQMFHSPWHGITAYDVIFPLFIFLSGMSLGLSAKPLSAYDADKQSQLIRKAIKRLLILCGLGVVYNHGWGQGMPTDIEQVRFASVLARIGIAGFIATLIVWYCQPKLQYTLFIGLLLGYYVLLEFVSIGDFGAGNYTSTGALNIWFDQHLLPGATYQNALVDPEGVLSNIGSVTNALAGLFVGRYFIHQLKCNRPIILPLSIIGVICLCLGYGLSAVMPINKTLWTSTFALVTIGYSVLLLVMFYWLFDVLNFKRLALFFTVIGMNAIVVYLASSIVDWQYIANSLFGGVVAGSPSQWQGVISVFCLVLVQWLFLYFLYKRNIFIKI